MTMEEIKKQRFTLLTMLRKFRKLRYDGSKLLPEIYKLDKMFEEMGGKPGKHVGFLTEEYWKNPENICNEQENSWPIVGVRNGKIIREHVKISLKQLSTTKQDEKIVEEEIKNKYYRINITWDSDINCHIIEQFFSELCIEVDRKLDDHSMSYIYSGGDEGFKMLKRSLMVICRLIYPESNVAVYGKQIKK